MKQLKLYALRCSVFAGIAAILFTTGPVQGEPETIALDTSEREIAIESDFIGADLVIFGAVDDSKQKSMDAGYYDVIVVVRGPSESLVARRKEQLAAIWVNGEARHFLEIPSFYGVLSTKPIEEIANEKTLQRLAIKLDPTPFENSDGPPDEFEQALVRLKTKKGLYVKAPDAVNFLSKSLFRATLRLPTIVTEGTYTVRVYLFHDMELLSWDNSFLDINKAGFERYVYTLAFERPYTYGIIAVFIAALSGLIGWTIFGRS
jgi:uncharacterized protein (TIGR02186 family)